MPTHRYHGHGMVWGLAPLHAVPYVLRCREDGGFPPNPLCGGATLGAYHTCSHRLCSRTGVHAQVYVHRCDVSPGSWLKFMSWRGLGTFPRPRSLTGMQGRGHCPLPYSPLGPQYCREKGQFTPNILLRRCCNLCCSHMQSRHMHILILRQTNTNKQRQTDKQTDRQPDRQTDRQQT